MNKKEQTMSEENDDKNEFGFIGDTQ